MKLQAAMALCPMTGFIERAGQSGRHWKSEPFWGLLPIILVENDQASDDWEAYEANGEKIVEVPKNQLPYYHRCGSDGGFGH